MRYVAVATALLALALYFCLSTGETAISKNATAKVVEATNTPLASPGIATQVESRTAKQATDAKVFDGQDSQHLFLVQNMPSLDTYRADASATPHEAPQSLQEFSDLVAERFAAAKNEPEKARLLFAELEECSLTQDPEKKILAIQSFCADMAGFLAKKRPELNDQWFSLQQRLPGEIKKMLAPI